MDLRISIVNYNTRDLLDACLASIRANPPDGPYEVVVVDNASVDDSVAMLREKYPEVTVIASPDNLGYAAGNNLAMVGSRARYFLVLNSDIEVHAGALQGLIDYLDSDPDCGMAGARLILPDGSIQHSCARRLTVTKYLTQQLLIDKAGLSRLMFGDYWINLSAVDGPLVVEQATGACMCCRREAIAEVGPMDEAYWMYCEDSDWCERFGEHRWKIVYVPTATMLHHVGGSSRTARGEMIAAYNHGAARYFRLHFGGFEAALARFIGILGATMRLALWTGLWLASCGRNEQHLKQMELFARTIWLTASPPAAIRPRAARSA